jgi:hypothetical protein
MEKGTSLAYCSARKRKDYIGQAELFLQDTEVSLTVNFMKHDVYFHDDTEKRDIYKITLTRGQREYSFTFGQSIADSRHYIDKDLKHKPIITEEKALRLFTGIELTRATVKGIPPNSYDILACLTKYDVGSLEDFCSEFGYDVDSKKAEKIYISVCKEWEGIQRIWTDKEIEILQQIN